MSMWTEGLDSNFIGLLTQRMFEAGFGFRTFIDSEGNLRQGWGFEGKDCTYDQWDILSRKIGREIQTERPEFAYIKI